MSRFEPDSFVNYEKMSKNIGIVRKRSAAAFAVCVCVCHVHISKAGLDIQSPDSSGSLDSLSAVDKGQQHRSVSDRTAVVQTPQQPPV